jgi:hypothetical protein
MEKSSTIPTAPGSAIEALRELSPSERLLGLYSYAIEGCGQRDKAHVTAVLAELVGIINFDYGEISQGFYRLYVFCLAKIQDSQFDQVAWILKDLHDAWAQAFSETVTELPLALSLAGRRSSG